MRVDLPDQLGLQCKKSDVAGHCNDPGVLQSILSPNKTNEHRRSNEVISLGKTGKEEDGIISVGDKTKGR